MIRALVGIAAAALVLIAVDASPASACGEVRCGGGRPDVQFAPGSVTAGSVSARDGAGLRVALSVADRAVSQRVYTLATPCQITDLALGGCTPRNFSCPQVEGRLIIYYFVLSQRIAQPGRDAIDGLSPRPDDAVGSTYGPVRNEGASCVDVTDLNPPPSPGEVLRYFQTLPLPQLATRQQPPGTALVGLPVIFFTDSPTTQTFTVDIRGFTVDIIAAATQFSWHTGTGTTLTTDNPGARYPNQTVSYPYQSGSYTAWLTTTWSATYRVDGGASADVPGTTTTDGPPVSFTVRQARAVLTDPTD